MSGEVLLGVNFSTSGWLWVKFLKRPDILKPHKKAENQIKNASTNSKLNFLGVFVKHFIAEFFRRLGRRVTDCRKPNNHEAMMGMGDDGRCPCGGQQAIRTYDSPTLINGVGAILHRGIRNVYTMAV